MEVHFYGRHNRIRFSILMQTPYQYLVEPIGERYNNVKKSKDTELIINTTRDETDFKYTNRLGRVVGIPRRPGLLERGDEVIVHHNTFRKWFNVRGKLKDSANFVKEGNFYVGDEQIFAFRRGDGEWQCIEDYCFIEPNTGEFGLYHTDDKDGYSVTRGKVYLNNPILESQGVSVGDEVVFNKSAAYRFDLFGKVLYKMSAIRNVKLIL